MDETLAAYSSAKLINAGVSVRQDPQDPHTLYTATRLPISPLLNLVPFNIAPLNGSTCAGSLAGYGCTTESAATV